MLLIPIGLIFVFFYINIPIGNFVVDILPDAVGYILIAVNLAKLKNRSYSFSNAFPVCLILAVYSLAVRLLQPSGMLGVLASLVELLMQLYLLRKLVGGIQELEYRVGTHLNSTVLDLWRKWLSVSLMVNYVFALMQLFIPWLASLGYIVVTAWAVLCILFITVFFRTDHRYHLLLKSQSEQGNADKNKE